MIEQWRLKHTLAAGCVGGTALCGVDAGAVGLFTQQSTIATGGVIDFVDPSADPNALGIEVGDPFSIEAIFDDMLLTGIGRETLTPTTDPSLMFELRIDRDPSIVWDQEDDSIHPFGPLINFEDGNFDSFVFQSNDFEFTSDAFVQVIDSVEILDSDSFDTLVTGSFDQVQVSPN